MTSSTTSQQTTDTTTNQAVLASAWGSAIERSNRPTRAWAM
jgi:hypothetical protein